MALPEGRCLHCDRPVEAYPLKDGTLVWLCLACVYECAAETLGLAKRPLRRVV